VTLAHDHVRKGKLRELRYPVETGIAEKLGVRGVIDFPDRSLCDRPSRRQTNVISTVCRIRDEVQRCKFQFHGATACIIEREREREREKGDVGAEI
jgi:hypothetical protein